MPQFTYDTDELKEMLDAKMAMSKARVKLRFISEYVGGQPASEDGVRAFAEHHLHLTGQSLDDAVKRILGEEVQQKSGGTDEVDEKESYGLNVIRRTADGHAYVGTWQVRAMLKAAASRLGIFAKKVGSKGDMSEGMIVAPDGDSELGTHQQIVLVKDGAPLAERTYRKFMGSVGTAKGRMSIVHDSEVAPVGSEISVRVEWPSAKISADDMATIWALGQRVGLGSVKALESGRFEIVSMEIIEPEKAKKEEVKV